MLVALGLLIGAPGIYIAGGLIRGVLVGVSPSDPLTLAAVALGLLVVTMATCYVPARRAIRNRSGEIASAGVNTNRSVPSRTWRPRTEQPGCMLLRETTHFRLLRWQGSC